VLVDRAIQGLADALAALPDHQSGMRDAVAHLIDLGHRRIALISGGMHLRASRERAGGLHLAFRERGITDDSIVITGRHDAAHGAKATSMLMSGAQPPTAIVAGTNQILIGVLTTLRELGLRPGRDLSLVTCDDTPLTSLLDPPIASISRDNVAIGRSAAEILLGAMSESVGAARQLLLPTSFRPTASCAPP
jgi:LacI family transcriptional regulator